MGRRAPLVGDRVAVVGAGMVGCCVAGCCPASRRPGQLVDVDPAARGGRGRARRRASPPRRRRRRTATWSSTPAPRRPGFSARWTCSRRRATVIDLSWYGDRESPCRWAARSTPAGSASAPARSARSPARAARRRTTADRLALALDLLRDPAFDALLTGESPFEELPDVMAPACADGSLPALCHTITYDEE